MKKRYPENVEELEGFYKSELGDLELMPDDDLYSRINSKLTNGTSVAPPFKKYFLFSMGLNGVLALMCIYFVIKNNDDPSKKNLVRTTIIEALPSENKSQARDHAAAENIHLQKAEDKKNEVKNEDINSYKEISFNKINKDKQAITNNPKQKTKNESNKEVETANSTEPAITTDAAEKKVEDVKIADNNKEQVKGGKTFYDKHVKQKADSAKPLFVPEK